MQSRKPIHKPDGTPKPYSELLIDAMRFGLGMPYPNGDGKWQWYDVDLAEYVDCSVGSINGWKKGRRPGAKNHANLVSVITKAEPHAREWKLAFDQAWKAPTEKHLHENAGKIPVAAGLIQNQNQQVASEEYFRARLSAIKNPVPCIVGPSYIDILLYPISTNRLYSDAEYSNLDMPDFILGGSSVFIGRYYQKLFGFKSDLYTTLPNGDHPLSALWTNLISHESWIKELCPVGHVSVPALTFALRQVRDGAKSMFTYPSDKQAFNWERIVQTLSKNSGRVIHFSGLVKTNLREGFLDHLEKVGKGNFVILDHGRFTPDAKETDYQYLIQEAIELGLIDIQICGIRDFAALYDINYDEARAYDDGYYIEVIENCLSRRGECRRVVTVIRDYDYRRRTPLFSAIVLGNPINIDRLFEESVRFPNGFAYPANKFNASLIGELKTADFDAADLETGMLEIIERAYINLVNKSVD